MDNKPVRKEESGYSPRESGIREKPVIPRPSGGIPSISVKKAYIFVSSHWRISQRFYASSDQEAREYVRNRYSNCPGETALYRLEKIQWQGRVL